MALIVYVSLLLNNVNPYTNQAGNTGAEFVGISCLRFDLKHRT